MCGMLVCSCVFDNFVPIELRGDSSDNTILAGADWIDRIRIVRIILSLFFYFYQSSTWIGITTRYIVILLSEK